MLMLRRFSGRQRAGGSTPRGTWVPCTRPARAAEGALSARLLAAPEAAVRDMSLCALKSNFRACGHGGYRRQHKGAAARAAAHTAGEEGAKTRAKKLFAKLRHE